MCIRDRVVAATTAPHRDTRCMARIAASRRSGRVHAGPPPNLNARLQGGVKIPRPHRERDRMAPVSRATDPRQFPLRPYSNAVSGNLKLRLCVPRGKETPMTRPVRLAGALFLASGLLAASETNLELSTSKG